MQLVQYLVVPLDFSQPLLKFFDFISQMLISIPRITQELGKISLGKLQSFIKQEWVKSWIMKMWLRKIIKLYAVRHLYIVWLVARGTKRFIRPKSIIPITKITAKNKINQPCVHINLVHKQRQMAAQISFDTTGKKSCHTLFTTRDWDQWLNITRP